MRYCLVLTFICAGAAMLLACSPQESPSESAANGEPVEMTQSRIELGREVYHAACARCHDEGVDGAPVIERPADWENRSRLWQALLFGHAERGYLEMPAQAGKESALGLSEEEVGAAAEYMLSITHPQMHAD